MDLNLLTLISTIVIILVLIGLRIYDLFKPFSNTTFNLNDFVYDREKNKPGHIISIRKATENDPNMGDIYTVENIFGDVYDTPAYHIHWGQKVSVLEKIVTKQ